MNHNKTNDKITPTHHLNTSSSLPQVPTQKKLTTRFLIYSPPGSGKTTFIRQVRQTHPQLKIGDTDINKTGSFDILLTNLPELITQYTSLALRYDRSTWDRMVKTKCDNWSGDWYDQTLQFKATFEHKAKSYVAEEIDLESYLIELNLKPTPKPTTKNLLCNSQATKTTLMKIKAIKNIRALLPTLTTQQQIYSCLQQVNELLHIHLGYPLDTEENLIKQSQAHHNINERTLRKKYTNAETDSTAESLTLPPSMHEDFQSDTKEIDRRIASLTDKIKSLDDSVYKQNTTQHLKDYKKFKSLIKQTKIYAQLHSNGDSTLLQRYDDHMKYLADTLRSYNNTFSPLTTNFFSSYLTTYKNEQEILALIHKYNSTTIITYYEQAIEAINSDNIPMPHLSHSQQPYTKTHPPIASTSQQVD